MRPLLAAVAAALAAVLAAPLAAGAAGPAVALRVDQLGYAHGETKVAYLLAAHGRPGASFTVVDSAGAVVLSGTAGPSRGRWAFNGRKSRFVGASGGVVERALQPHAQAQDGLRVELGDA